MTAAITRQVAVLGAGGWGTALAVHLAREHRAVGETRQCNACGQVGTVRLLRFFAHATPLVAGLEFSDTTAVGAANQ